MYIANLTYPKPLSEIGKYSEEHVVFLGRYYEAEKFVCSGRKNPHIDGVILFHAKDEAEMKQIISEDPFHINGIVSYEITEFNPTGCAPNFQCFTEQ